MSVYERSPNSLLVPPNSLQPQYDEEIEASIAPPTLLYPVFDRHLKTPLDEVLARTHEDVSYLNYLKPSPQAFEAAKAIAVETDEEAAYDAVVAIRPSGVIPASYEDREDGLLELRSHLHGMISSPLLSEDDTDLEDVVGKLYLWRVNELIAESRMMRAVHEGNAYAIKSYNEYLYGAPDSDVFAQVVTRFRTAAEDATGENLNSAIREAAEFVIANLPPIEGDPSMLEPNPAVFERVRDEHFGPAGHFPLLFAGIELPEKGPVKPEVGEAIIAQAMKNIEADGYNRVFQTGGWAADNDRKTLGGPEKYSMPLKRFIGLPNGHELTHIIESINGGRQPLLLMQTGLDRYERGNEGRAVIREQVPYETFEDFAVTRRWEDILRRHLATTFMAGMWPEGTTNKTFIKTLGSIDHIFENANNKKGLTHEELVEKAQGRTWSLVERVLGRKIYKDMLYLEGNISVWDVAERIADGDLGKSDVANRRHITKLGQLGILR